MFNDKNGILNQLTYEERVVLELGCGETKQDSSAIGIDLLDSPCVDIVGDVFEVLEAIPAGSISAVNSYHFFEHVDDTDSLLAAIARVLGPGGKLKIVVPHFSNPFFYSDPTHKSTFGLYTFSYLSKDQLFTRRVPNYGKSLQFSLDSVELGFKSYRPRYLRHALKLSLGKLVNLSPYTKEFYEENLTGLFPCYELEFLLTKI